MERRQRMEGGAQARRRAGRAGLALFAAFLAVALAPVPGTAQTGRDPAETRVDARPWSVDARLRNTFRSHTSYEFGLPPVPGHTPLSRLEFPINATWAGIGARGGTSRFSVGMEIHVCVEADYLRILTTGSHRLSNPLFDLDYSFEYGVKVWSEQMGLTMSLEWTF